MGFSAGHWKEKQEDDELLLLPFWLLLPLLSPRPSPRLMLTPTSCMEDMVGMDWDTLAMEDTVDIDTLDMPDTMDIPMEDMPTLDKLLPLISKWTANHPCFLYQ